MLHDSFFIFVKSVTILHNMMACDTQVILNSHMNIQYKARIIYIYKLNTFIQRIFL